MTFEGTNLNIYSFKETKARRGSPRIWNVLYGLLQVQVSLAWDRWPCRTVSLEKVHSPAMYIYISTWWKMVDRCGKTNSGNSVPLSRRYPSRRSDLVNEWTGLAGAPTRGPGIQFYARGAEHSSAQDVWPHTAPPAPSCPLYYSCWAA